MTAGFAGTALRPLEVLVEGPDADGTELSGALCRAYGGQLGLASSAVYTNFVASVDGTVALAGVPRSNRLISGGSEADRFVMGLLRALADVVVVGAGTLHGSPTGTWSPGRAHPPSAQLFAELRRGQGRPERPELAILTGSGAIDPGHPALGERTVVLTTSTGAARLRGRVPDRAALMPLATADPIAPQDVIAALRERGHRRILFEAGPHTFGSFTAAGMIGELFLTVSPLLTGGSAQTRSSLLEGVEPLHDGIVGGELLTVRRHDDHLFLRYRLRSPRDTASPSPTPCL